MPSLYSLLYPAGMSAAGVALLRLGVAVFVLMLLDASPHHAAVLVAVVWLSASALVVGFLTRCVAIVVAGVSLLLWRQSGDASGGLLALGGLAALALAMIGAGAFSVDAHLFGRRVIELDE